MNYDVNILVTTTRWIIKKWDFTIHSRSCLTDARRKYVKNKEGTSIYQDSENCVHRNYGAIDRIQFLTLQRHLTHLISPCDAILGCHSLPFSNGPPTGKLQPPEARISLVVRRVESAAWSRGSMSPVRPVTGGIIGQRLQHAFLSGLIAVFSSQSKGGHCSRGHLTSRVMGCVQINIHIRYLWQLARTDGSFRQESNDSILPWIYYVHN